VGNNPLRFVDPDGLEVIVVSGGYAGYEKFKYNFIETGIKALSDLKRNHPDENITWVIANAGYSKKDIINFYKTAEKLGVNVLAIDHKDELINYINTKGESIENRKADKITHFAVLSHGYSEEIALAHGRSAIEKERLNFKIEDINKLSDDAFDNTISWFGACNTGTIGKSGTSFAQEWSNKTGGVTVGVVNGTTWYGNINHWEGKTFLDRLELRVKRLGTGYNQSGSVNLPIASHGVKWGMFLPQEEDEKDEKGDFK